jgi:hypothetical protein
MLDVRKQMFDVRCWMLVESVRGELPRLGRSGCQWNRGAAWSPVWAGGVLNDGSLPHLPGLVILENYLR